MTDPYLRATNDSIARNYDAFVYDPVANPLLDIARIVGIASLHGSATYPTDVLDLGCGTGAQLAQAASQVTGRVVGTDISPEACRRAMGRLDPFQDRAQLICGDLLDIAPEQLGQFDLIYNIGVIYVTPLEVQRRILEIIGKCLRPGGMAVLSYYAGSVPTLRANLHQALRSACTGLEPEAAIAHVRAQLEFMASSLAEVDRADIRRRAVSDTAELSDMILFHEVLNNSFEAMRTTALERTLASFGLSFASYLPCGETAEGSSSIQRAIAADVADFRSGRYHYAVFAKYDRPAVAEFLARPDVWQSDLVRTNRGEFVGEQVYSVPGSSLKATIRSPASMAMFDCLMDGPLAWAELSDRTERILASRGIDIDAAARELMAGDLRNLLRYGAVYPLGRRS